MKREKVLKTLQKLESKSKKRNFDQSIELIINFKGLNPKKLGQQVDLKVELPYSTGRSEGKALLFAKTKPFADSVKEDFDKIIFEEEIPKLKKENIQRILSYDVLLAEGPVMLTVGKHLGQQLAPKGKMPQPVEPNPDQVREKLEKLKTRIRVTNRRGKGVPLVQVLVGKESMKAEEIAENVIRVFEEVERSLPKQRQNIKSVLLKKTMSPVAEIQ